MIADYFVIRRKELNVAALYSATGGYAYSGGISWVAITALAAGALPSLPGFLVTIKVLDGSGLPALLLDLYHYAWFVGFGLAFAVYLILRKLAPSS